jgi:SP family arabinose:H+ symporter-like MFS transporter
MRNKLTFICTVAAFSGFLYGLQSVMTGAIPFLRIYFNLNDSAIGLAASASTFGGILGTLLGGPCSDRYGRRQTLAMSGILFIIFPIASALVSNFSLFVALRFLTGISLGISSVVAPMYIAEVATANRRGQLVSYFQLFMVSGILISFVASWLLISYGNVSWRYMMIVPAIPAIFFLWAIFRIPESPQWLLQQGKTEKAKSLAEANQLNLELLHESTSKKSTNNYRILFAPKYRRVIVMGIILAVFQQFVGIAPIITYAPSIFMSAGLSESAGFFSTILLGLSNLIFTIVSAWSVDRWGRKPLLIIGLGVIFLSLSLLSSFFYLHVNAGMLSAALLLIYQAAFALSVGPLLWVMLSEIFPLEIKGLASSIANFSLWFSSAFISLFFPPIVAAVGEGNVFAFFAISALIYLFFILLKVPETRNRKLEVITRALTQK